jgi:NAD(P)-dependent dehydrogenase (short-subunit alcohol dehydrogenase family)
MSETMKGKVALVTGGGTGIGRATALAFAAEGARVIIASRTAETGQRTVGEIEAAGGEALWIESDVTQASQVNRMVEQTVAQYGRLDIAFNNAGSGGGDGPLAEMADSAWDATLLGYLTSTFYCLKAEVKQMLRQGSGAIVNNSSVEGKRAFTMDPAYSAAKHGVLGLTKSTALQYATQGIRINAVCPGWIKTPPIERMLARDPANESLMLDHQPIGRLGEAEEVAAAVLWLCSDKASFITGIALDVDGGYLAL